MERMKKQPGSVRLWLGRILIGAVLVDNVQCAILFLCWPEVYTPGFELSGIPGAAMVRGLGVLFLMWNIPYAVALLDPLRHRVSLYEAVAMQAIGLAGEMILRWTLPIGHPQLQSTVTRFVVFDAFGLVALLLAAWITRSKIMHSLG
jgi:hypothetical protein